MLVLKIYLLSSLFYFLLIVITGLLFRKKFLKSVSLIDKILERKETPKEGITKTTFRYLLISFIPTVRLVVFIEKMIITFKPYIIVQYVLKEREKKNVNDKNN